jgi:predicted porin
VVSFDAVRFQNSLAYNTPSFNGLSAQLIHVAKNDRQSAGSATGNSVNQQYGRDGLTEIGLTYAQGPLAIRFANLNLKQDSGYLDAGTVTRGTTGKYAVNRQIDLAYFYQKASSENLMKTGAAATINAAGTALTAATAASAIAYDRKTNGLAVTYQVTPTIKLMANRAQVTIGDETAAGTDGQKTVVTGLGLDYSMSKRTTGYVRYENDDDKAGVRAITGYTAATGNTTYTATAVGIRHTF